MIVWHSILWLAIIGAAAFFVLGALAIVSKPKGSYFMHPSEPKSHVGIRHCWDSVYDQDDESDGNL